MTRPFYLLVLIVALGMSFNPRSIWAQKVTLSLDGQWKVGDSVRPEEMPYEYGHTVPGPGLTHSATPTFPDVDCFETRQSIRTRLTLAVFPKIRLFLTLICPSSSAITFGIQGCFASQPENTLLS